MTFEERPVPVWIRHRVRVPPLQWTGEGWVIAWTRNAVLCFWMSERPGQGPETGWLYPENVRRKDLPASGSSAR